VSLALRPGEIAMLIPIPGPHLVHCCTLRRTTCRALQQPTLRLISNSSTQIVVISAAWKTTCPSKPPFLPSALKCSRFRWWILQPGWSSNCAQIAALAIIHTKVKISLLYPIAYSTITFYVERHPRWCARRSFAQSANEWRSGSVALSWSGRRSHGTSTWLAYRSMLWCQPGIRKNAV